MGFFDKLGEYAGEQVNKAVKDYQSASKQAQRMDNQDLYKKFNNESNFVRKMSYGMEFKKRQAEMENRNNDDY